MRFILNTIQKINFGGGSILVESSVAWSMETDIMKIVIPPSEIRYFSQVRRGFVAVFLLAACASGAWAQGAVQGTVSDPLGAVVKEA